MNIETKLAQRAREHADETGDTFTHRMIVLKHRAAIVASGIGLVVCSAMAAAQMYARSLFEAGDPDAGHTWLEFGMHEYAAALLVALFSTVLIAAAVVHLRDRRKRKRYGL